MVITYTKSLSYIILKLSKLCDSPVSYHTVKMYFGKEKKMQNYTGLRD